MALQKDLKEFIQSLNSNEVEYLIVGAYAVAFHGRPRLTGDIDFFIRRTSENASKVVRAIQQFSNGAIIIDPGELLVPDRMLRIGHEPNRVDILTSISGVEFDAAWINRVDAVLDGLPVRFIGLEELCKNKLATGRLKDAADVEEIKGTD